MDIAEDKSVDVVIKLGDKLPFNDSSVDYIISNSAFEHDPCFWMTFKEMTRIIKEDGFIYVNSPSSGPYHPYVTDNYRFYADAGQALAYWSGIQVVNEPLFPVKVVETFNILGTEWKDFCCIWKRTENKETSHILPEDIVKTKGKTVQPKNKKPNKAVINGMAARQSNVIAAVVLVIDHMNVIIAVPKPIPPTKPDIPTLK